MWELPDVEMLQEGMSVDCTVHAPSGGHGSAVYNFSVQIHSLTVEKK